MANKFFRPGILGLLHRQIRPGVATLRASLLRGYDFVSGHQFLSDVLDAGGTLEATATLEGATFDRKVLDAADVTFPAVPAGPPCDAVLIYQSSAADGGPDVAPDAQRLVARIDRARGLPFTPSGVDLVLAWGNSLERIGRLRPSFFSIVKLVEGFPAYDERPAFGLPRIDPIIDIRQGIQLFLKADPVLAAALGDRIRPGWIGEADTYPTLVFNVISDIPESYSQGGGKPTSLARVQFDAFGEWAGDVTPVKDRLRLLLHGFRGDMAGVDVKSAYKVDEHDLPYASGRADSGWMARIQVDFTFRYYLPRITA